MPAGFDAQAWYEDLFSFGLEEEGSAAGEYAANGASDSDLVPRLVAQAGACLRSRVVDVLHAFFSAVHSFFKVALGLVTP